MFVLALESTVVKSVGLTDRIVQTGIIKTRIREGGEGQSVVFLHGTSGMATIWDPILTGLLPRFHVVAVDQRGHGLSDKPQTGYMAADYTADLASLIDCLDCGRVVVVGHSLGARNAVVLGALREDLVSGVVAIDFTPFLADEVFDGIASRVGTGAQTFATLDDVAVYLRHRYPRFPEDAIHRRVMSGYIGAPDGSGFVALADAEAMRQTTSGLRESFEWAVKSITCPVMLIRGRESALVSEEAFNRTLQLRPDFQGVTLDGVDHYIPEAIPDVVCGIVDEFAGHLP